MYIIYTMYPGPGMQIKRNERQEKKQTWKSTIEVWRNAWLQNLAQIVYVLFLKTMNHIYISYK